MKKNVKQILTLFTLSVMTAAAGYLFIVDAVEQVKKDGPEFIEQVVSEPRSQAEDLLNIGNEAYNQIKGGYENEMYSELSPSERAELGITEPNIPPAETTALMDGNTLLRCEDTETLYVRFAKNGSYVNKKVQLSGIFIPEEHEQEALRVMNQLVGQYIGFEYEDRYSEETPIDQNDKLAHVKGYIFIGDYSLQETLLDKGYAELLPGFDGKYADRLKKHQSKQTEPASTDIAEQTEAGSETENVVTEHTASTQTSVTETITTVITTTDVQTASAT